ncbi:MAG: metal-dependent hydrolase [Planctomycetes bacterium]|nr:metal-dependent hydrolase [Planctomycetota bacterium]
MPTVFSHALLGYAAAELAVPRRPTPRGLRLLATLLPVLPDADSLFMRWIPYEAPFGHRGFTHSLFFAFALGGLASLVLRPRSEIFGGRRSVCAVFLGAVVATHGLLDAMTDGGRGIAFFAPFENERYFFDFRPIPVAPISVRWFFSGRMFADPDFWKEVLLFWPLCAAAIAGKAFPGPRGRFAAGFLAGFGVASWVWVGLLA